MIRLALAALTLTAGAVGVGVVLTHDSDSESITVTTGCPEGLVRTYSLDRGDYSRCVKRPVISEWREPYGGCKEAHQEAGKYPHSVGYRECVIHGRLSEWRPFRDVEGHTNCWINVGPTSRVICADGFETTS